MQTSTDVTFIVNDEGKTLLDRFCLLIKDTRHFDCLVGYFYATGFFSLRKPLESTEKIRILIGLSTDRQTFDLIQTSKDHINSRLIISNKELKNVYSEELLREMNESPDSNEVEEGIRTFIEWLKNGKLEIKVYPS